MPALDTVQELTALLEQWDSDYKNVADASEALAKIPDITGMGFTLLELLRRFVLIKLELFISQFHTLSMIQSQKRYFCSGLQVQVLGIGTSTYFSIHAQARQLFINIPTA